MPRWLRPVPEVLAGTTVKVVENTADTLHLVLPVTPANADKLSNEDLEELAGGSYNTEMLSVMVNALP